MFVSFLFLSFPFIFSSYSQIWCRVATSCLAVAILFTLKNVSFLVVFSKLVVLFGVCFVFVFRYLSVRPLCVQPKRIEALDGVKVLQVAMGTKHMVAVVETED